jgi:hypothetical protein
MESNRVRLNLVPILIRRGFGDEFLHHPAKITRQFAEHGGKREISKRMAEHAVYPVICRGCRQQVVSRDAHHDTAVPTIVARGLTVCISPSVLRGKG